MTELSRTTTKKAGANVYANRFVKLSTTDAGSVILGAAAADRTPFITCPEQLQPPGIGTDGLIDSGYAVRIFMPGSEAVLEVGSGGLTVGDGVVSDGTGKGVTVTATAGRPFWAMALETAAAGDLARVLLVPGVVTS